MAAQVDGNEPHGRMPMEGFSGGFPEKLVSQFVPFKQKQVCSEWLSKNKFHL